MNIFGVGLGPDEEIADEGEMVITLGSDNQPSKRIFERKYKVPRSKRLLLLAILRHRTLEPIEFPTARIKTVYFDDRGHTSFYESVEGALYKRKYRLREYVGSTAPGARYSIEIKMRNDSTTEKLKELVYAPLPENYRFTTFRELIGELEESKSLSRLRVALPERELFADTVIGYERYRFDDPLVEARYNLDVDVTLSNEGGAFAPDSTLGTARLEHDIFEIKSSKPMGLPSYLAGLNMEPVSFSKFVWGRETDYYL